MDDIIYFELNNWDAGSDYPNEEPFLDWMSYNDGGPIFRKNDWTKKNELCVVAFFYDMSQTFCITAKKSWVDKNCPGLLKYPRFIRKPDKDGETNSRFGGYFKEYKPENFGVTWIQDPLYGED